MPKLAKLAKNALFVSPKKKPNSENDSGADGNQSRSSNSSTNENGTTTITTTTPNPSGEASLAAAKRRHEDRIPKWLLSEGIDEESFAAILKKCFSLHDKKRLAMVSS